MKTIKKLLLGALAGAALGGASALPALAEGVKQSQTVSLQPGWNTVYITVEPDETPDVIFRDWPVEWVGRYDPATFLDTKQYSGTTSTEGSRTAGFVMWRRAEGPLSPLKRINANCAYVCFSTNAAGSAAYAQTLYGRPGAPRITWHPSSTNEPMNYVGFSLGEGQTTLDGYFNGADIGNVTYQYFMQGANPEKPSLVPVSGSATFTNGDVVVMTSTKASDWSGVLYVSPMDGVNFSTNLTKGAVTVRNDSAKARTVRLTLGQGASVPSVETPSVPLGLKWRDGASGTNAWQNLSEGVVLTRGLAVGETFRLELALDRSQYAAASVGRYYGSLLQVEDVTVDGSKMRVTVPVEATSDGGASAANAWPKGLWLASGVLNQVNYFASSEQPEEGDGADPRAGGMVKVRLPMYVDGDGKMTLLQRVTYGVDSNGTLHVYSGALTTGTNCYPTAISNARRISSAVLPIDQPCIAARDGDVFGGLAVFPFVVGEHSRANPLRHALHPMHDGLSSDYESPAPSGDNLENYVTSTVKPELFSITNRITFVWKETQGATWDPAEMRSGLLTWELDGVRHGGTVRMSGAFSMKRVSSVTLDK